MVKRPDTFSLLESGLKAANLRQSTIANNLANIQTPNFRRSEVEFKGVLAEALQGGRTDSVDFQAKIVQPGTTPVNETGNDVDVDREIGDMIENSGTYSTYMRVMTKLYRQMDLAIQ
jgi:flagellar basal-body rod protein FlgB